MSGTPIKIPQIVRLAHGIPANAVPLAVFSVWSMEGGRRGLWVGKAGSSTGQRWPVTGVAVEEAQAWLDAAQGKAS